MEKGSLTSRCLHSAEGETSWGQAPDDRYPYSYLASEPLSQPGDWREPTQHPGEQALCSRRSVSTGAEHV